MFSTSETQAGNTLGGRRDPDGDFFVVVKLCGNKRTKWTWNSAESQSHSASNMKAMNLIRHEMRQLPDKTRSKIFYIFLRKKSTHK